ncbi:hypothetical protein HQN90_28750 [Paenibacillus alba]|uniref:hypothetical protein n=1 Tax=Paenibacillus alba TaxID=1197127 RepID=UPI0015669EAA|nr:hypothetical protein [Paenibacillus alba]NQX70132.1 hypothetical protein [Paenibacillus alba]
MSMVIQNYYLIFFMKKLKIGAVLEGGSIEPALSLPKKQSQCAKKAASPRKYAEPAKKAVSGG